MPEAQDCDLGESSSTMFLGSFHAKATYLFDVSLHLALRMRHTYFV
jgi:hypothetical protein